MEFLNRSYKNFDALADNVVSSVADRGDRTAILAALVKEARRVSLKPKEVERLVEGVNLQLTLDHLKTASDKRSSFPVIAKDEALAQTHGIKADTAPPPAQQTTEKTAAHMQFSASDFVSNTDSVDLMSIFGLEKQASVESRTAECSALFKLDLAYKSARQEVLASTEKIADTYDHLLSTFSQYKAPSFTEFSTKVASLHGASGKALCDALAADLGVSAEYVKTASIINDTQPEMVKAAEFLQEFDNCVQLRKVCADAEARLSKYREDTWSEFRTRY